VKLSGAWVGILYARERQRMAEAFAHQPLQAATLTIDEFHEFKEHPNITRTFVQSQAGKADVVMHI
jgi:hypothetical protein